MNATVLLNIARFVLLLAAQVLIFNNMQFLGYINPYPYVLFLILYPVNGNRYGLLLSAFLLGILLDSFLNSGGVHTTACIALAYFRPAFFKFSFGVSYEYQTIKINDRLTPERFSFIAICVLLHHVILFILETFRFSFFFDIVFRTIFSSIFTILLCIIIIYIFKPNKR
ncbi:rod shape-determining protein MreD [Flavobacterium pallidum]|uniref:Rod shape-determining protein MreD n=1 Tax=Flavobacterium pallidum TaxID=2172098 RepID=A0A2S1SGD8_9FLAO|nr:rod shape-determining protein MreD [Flavobacterium pallidum]AWI25474.1 rod shape-determining protein MreD [Flavobacterium pallidum]